VNYAKLTKSTDFYYAKLVQKIDDDTPNKSMNKFYYEGWLLYEGPQKIVLYNGPNAKVPIQILNPKNFTSIQILSHKNIFSKLED